MIFTIIFLIFALIALFWLVSLLVAGVAGAPTVYAKSRVIQRALEITDLKKNQLVVDLGCGDARTLIYAAKHFSAKGVGVEISPFYYLLARFKVTLAGQSRNIRIYFSGFQKIEQRISRADVVYMYLFDTLLNKIEPWLFKTVKSSVKIISVGFRFKNHQPDISSTNPKILLYLSR